MGSGNRHKAIPTVLVDEIEPGGHERIVRSWEGYAVNNDEGTGRPWDIYTLPETEGAHQDTFFLLSKVGNERTHGVLPLPQYLIGHMLIQIGRDIIGGTPRTAQY